MNRSEKWIAVANEIWRPLRIYHEEGRRFQMAVCKRNADLVLKAFFDNYEANASYSRIYGLPVVAVGVDIREWTRRDFAVQSFMTVNLQRNLRKSIDYLNRGGLVHFADPLHISYTGDGAIILFGGRYAENPYIGRVECGHESEQLLFPCIDKTAQPCIEKIYNAPCDSGAILAALSFVFTLNALTQQDNFGKRFQHIPGTSLEQHYSPLYLRYAISYGHVFPILDAFDNLQFVGAPLVTCSRILSTDHGNHFLIDAKLLHEMDAFGGLSGIGTINSATNWKQDLSISELPDRRVKSGTFRYADIVGHHEDGPLLFALGKTAVTPSRYQIGSHDRHAIEL